MPPDPMAPDAGVDALLETAPTPGRVQLINPKTREIFSVDEAEAEAAQAIHGLAIAQPEEIKEYTLQQRFGRDVGDKAKTAGEVIVGTGAELAEAASKRGMFQPTDPLTGAPIGPAAIDTTGEVRPGVALEAQKIAPFVYTPEAKARRRANPNTAVGAGVALDLATAGLIPQYGVAGLLGSAALSGLITEGTSTVIEEDEYSLKDAMIAAGGSFALEGAGALAITGAMKATGRVRNYLDGAVDRARRVATEGAAAETDVALAAEKMRRNAEELYTKHQTDLDEALAEIDARTTGAPERMFTPGALKKTVSENLRAQEEAFLDVAVKFDQAAEVADVAGIAEVKATLQDALGKSGPGMYEALRTARRQLDELGDVSSPLVKEAAAELDKSLRSQPTWGKAAKNYADIADEAGDVADTVSVNLREANARDVLDQRLDRARRLNAITGDKKLAAQLKRAEKALEEADKVTGARVLGETTPDEIAQLQKKLDGFEKRAPKLAKEIHSSHGRLNKQLGGILGEMTEDGALDYVAVRASGFGGKTDPVRDMFVKAEKRIAAMKAAGDDPTKIARATAELSSFRKTVAEAAEMPRAAQRIRDWHARPGIGGKVNQALNNVPLDEIENVLQTAMPASAATLGGVAFGIPGYIGGYLGGRLLYKRFGRKISEVAWNKAKKEIGGHALQHPGEAATGALGAFAGGVLAHGNAPGAVAGYIAGRKAGQLIGKGAKRAWRTAKRVIAEPGAPPPMGTPLGGAAKTDAKAAAATKKAAREAEREAKRAAKAPAKSAAPPDLDPELARTLNMADTALREAQRGGDAAKISKASAAYNAALKAAGQNLHTIAGAGLAGAGALAGEEHQTEGAAAASAGLLLLLLPRNIGRRAVFRQLEEAAARAARRVHGTELAPLRRALEAARADMRSTLREATESAVDWRPDELIEMQAQRVKQVYAEEMRPGEWRAGNHSGNMSEEADAYLRAELARINAGWVNGDAALRRTYDQAAREADIAERAPRGDNPSPQAMRRDRVNDLQPERAARLEHDARLIRERLPSQARDLMSRVFSSAQTELGDMARAYVGARDTVSGLLRSADDLMAAQIEHLNETWQALRLDLPPNLSAVEIQNAAEAELRSMNAAIAQQNAPRRMVAPDAPRSTSELMGAELSRQRSRVAEFVRPDDDPNRLSRLQYETHDAYHRSGLSTPEREQVRQAIEEARPELSRMFEAFVTGEGHTARISGAEFDLADRIDLINAQDAVLREYVTRRSGLLRHPAALDRIAETEIDYTNVLAARNRRDAAHAAEEAQRRARQEGERIQAGRNQRQAAEYKAAERERNLKHPDPEARPAMVDGIPTDAAIRLDDALQEDAERLIRRHARSAQNADEVMLVEERPAFVERARQFARDNPGLISEDDAAAYATRRWEEIGDDEANIRWLEDGGYARAEIQPDLADDAFDDELTEALQDQIAEVDYTDEDSIRYASVDTDSLVARVLRRNDLTPRQERQLRQMVAAREERYQRYMDEDLRESHNNWRDENPDSEPPDSEPPDSEDPPSSDGYREDYRTSRANYTRGDEDGLPPNEELEAIGLRQLEVASNHGVENVFGRALETDEVRRLFSLDYLKKYAAEAGGGSPHTSLVVTPRRVEFEGQSGAFRIAQTYTAGSDGLDIHYELMKLPPEWQGKAVMKEMVGDMVGPVESLGGGEATMSSAWVGKYSWLMLGAEPSEYATKQALRTYQSDLERMLGAEHPAVAMSMARITNTQELANAWLPKELIVDNLPELRQTWNEVAHKWSADRVELQPFDEAVFRTSRSGNEQFLSGKYFLLMREGDWNSGLRLKIKPGDPKYENFKKILGLGGGAAALGFGLHELQGAFTGTDMHISGIGGELDEADTAPPEVLAYDAEQAEKIEKVERTREKLGYLKTETEIIVRDTARAVANAHPRARVVSGVPGVTHSKGVGAFLGSHSTLRAAFDDKRQTLETLQRDPMTLVDELTEGLSELQENAPALHAKMVQQTYKVVEFLNSKLPSTVGASLTRPEGSPTSPLAIRQFALYYSAATDPSSVMGDLANNRAQKEQVDTLRQLWPDIYTDLKLAMVDQLSKGRPTVAQRTRMDLLFDFGDTLEKGLSPRLVAALNQHRAAQGPGGEGGAQKGAQVPQRRSQPSIGGTSATAALGYGPAAGPGTLA